jgi:hypothetical protein
VTHAAERDDVRHEADQPWFLDGGLKRCKRLIVILVSERFFFCRKGLSAPVELLVDGLN